MIPVVRENTTLKHFLPVPIGIPRTFVKEITNLFPLVTDKTVKVLSKYSKAAMFLASFFTLALLFTFTFFT